MPDLSKYALCITHETFRRHSFDDYNAGKVTVDIRGWDDKAQRPTYVPSYDFPLAKLTLMAWYSEKFPPSSHHPSGTYGQELGVDLGADLLTMASLTDYTKPLKALHKKLDAIQARFGYAQSVGQTLAYLADALGITRFARPNEHHRPSLWQSSTDPQDAIRWVDRPIAEFHEAAQQEEKNQHTSAA